LNRTNLLVLQATIAGGEASSLHRLGTERIAKAPGPWVTGSAKAELA